MNDVLEQLRPVIDDQPYPLLFASLSGAHLYGFPSPDSDYDVRGVHVLPLDDMIRLSVPRETINNTRMVEGMEVDLVTHDVKTFMLLLLKKNGNMLEQIFSPLVLHSTPYLEQLREIAPGCITRYIAFHYLGFAANKWKEFDNQEHKQAKTLLYVYRVLMTGLHLMRTQEVQPNLQTLADVYGMTHIPDLIAAKIEDGEKAILSAPDVVFHQAEHERLTGELEDMKDKTALPEKPARKDDLNQLLLEIRKDMGKT